MLRAFEILFWSKNKITPIYHRFMGDFERNTCDGNFSIGGKQLRKIIKILLSLYYSLNKKAVVSSTVTKSPYVSVVHKLLDKFINYYMNNKQFRQILMVGLVKGCVYNFKGVVNPLYSAKLLDLFLDLAVIGDQKAFQFVSGNMCGFLLSHMHHLNQKQRTKTFLNIDQH